jgi:hypothetical protein
MVPRQKWPVWPTMVHTTADHFAKLHAYLREYTFRKCLVNSYRAQTEASRVSKGG